MSKNTKTLLIGLSVFLVVLVGVLVVYLVQKPTKKTVVPSPTPVAQVSPKPEVPVIAETGEAACSLSFTVTEDVEQPVCNETCNDTTLLCPSNLECIGGLCRNPACEDEADCVCSSSTPSVSPSASPSSPPGAELECVIKRAYENDSRNTAGTYYLNNEIIDTNTITNGQVIVYNIVMANRGGVDLSDTSVTDVLSTNLTYMDGSTGCSYDSATRKVTCDVGALPGNTEATVSIRAQVAVAGTSSINNTAEVFSTNGQRDTCAITVSATGEIVQSPSPIPSALPEAGVMEVTTTTLGLGVLLLLTGALGLLLL